MTAAPTSTKAKPTKAYYESIPRPFHVSYTNTEGKRAIAEFRSKETADIFFNKYNKQGKAPVYEKTPDQAAQEIDRRPSADRAA